MKHSPDNASSHEYEVKRVHMDGAREAGGMLDPSEEATLDIYGFRPIPAGGTPVTNELVNKLREELGI